MEKAGDGLAPPAALAIDVSATMENQMSDVPPLKDGDRIVIIKRGSAPDRFSLECHPTSGEYISAGPMARPLDEILAEIRAEQTRP